MGVRLDHRTPTAPIRLAPGHAILDVVTDRSPSATTRTTPWAATAETHDQAAAFWAYSVGNSSREHIPVEVGDLLAFSTDSQQPDRWFDRERYGSHVDIVADVYRAEPATRFSSRRGAAPAAWHLRGESHVLG